jgi:hypothetical protein
MAGVGCGNERQAIPTLQLEPSADTKEWRFPKSGVAMSLPANYSVARRERPGVFRATLGEAFVSVFAYRRREQLPRSRRELRVARRRLVQAAKKRSRTYELRSARVGRFAGLRAVDLVGDQTISAGRLRTRSLHLFKGTVEYVIELLCPQARFESVEKGTIPRIARSLKLTGKLQSASERKKKRRRR